MARKPRIEFSGALYYVMSRSSDGVKTFFGAIGVVKGSIRGWNRGCVRGDAVRQGGQHRKRRCFIPVVEETIRT